MTHTPVPPRPILSGDGHRIACPHGEGVWLIDTSGPRRATVAHVVDVAAWGPSGLVVAGDGQVSALGTDDQVSWTRAFPARVSELALDGRVLAIALAGDGPSVQLLDPLTSEPVGRIDLGDVEIEGLLVSADQLLVWGFTGSDADHHADTGPWFGRLFSTTGVERWAGEGVPSEPQGVLWPLSSGVSDRPLIGVFDVSSLRILQSAGNRWTVLATHPWSAGGLSASSPGGRLVATLTAEWNGTADAYSVRVLDLHADEVVFDTAVEEPGLFPTIAVDDDARLTLASGYSGAELSVLTCTSDGTTAVRHDLG